MIRLYAEQLGAQLKESLLHPCYFLFGNDPLLLQESQDCIRDCALAQQFDEHFSSMLDANTDWDMIFSICQVRSLFASRQMLLLVLPDGGIHPAIGAKLLKLASLRHEDMLLILRGNKLTSSLANSSWFKVLSQNAVLVRCATPEQKQLQQWVVRRAKSMNLILEDSACNMLCYCYEGNLLALSQALELLSLLYIDGSLITLLRVEAAVHNAAHFTPLHWVQATLAGQSKRAVHILSHLQLEAVEPVLLLRSIQREVLFLIKLKRQMAAVSIRTLFDHHKVWQNRRLLLTQALGRLTMPKLRDSVMLMTKIELVLKQDSSYPVWSHLNALAMLLCDQRLLPPLLPLLPVGMLDG